MLTGNHDKNIVRASMQAGANDFIVKPFQRKVLLTKMTTLLREMVLDAPSDA